MLRTVDTHRQTRTQGRRPTLSEMVPMMTEAIPTPKRAVMGIKYVAALKSNGEVLSNESCRT
eukprot:scaffold125362_cov56-Attheya_sp.AAC.3